MSTSSEIKSWLSPALQRHKIKDFDVKVAGNTSKGDGYLGDILFVEVTSRNGVHKKFDLVLKCSKRSTSAREMLPIRDTFLNEIYTYEVSLPALMKFQSEKGLKDDRFCSFGRFYGSYVTDDLEILILENLKEKGFEMWDRKKSETRNHLELVLGEYGKLHGTSLAMKDQQREEFEKIAGGVKDIIREFSKRMSVDVMMGKALDDTLELLEDELSEDALKKWRKARKRIEYMSMDVFDGNENTVITHGDAWNNNFMFYSQSGDPTKPTKVAILDWQMSKYCSPVRDLSYYLFTTISEEDIKHLDELLEHYYKSLANHVTILGSDPEKLYPRRQFLADWKKFSRFGLVMLSVIVKLSLTEKENAADVEEVSETGGDMSEIFAYEINNKEEFKRRMKYVMEYAAEHNLV